MWLINTETGYLRDFVGADIPEYAILSHRWGADDEEQTFKDFQKGRGEHRVGHQKILDFCFRARGDGYSWAWVDTCCIDKRSSAELTESINSMFVWYQRSARCYVYMVDVDRDQRDWLESAWWTRGWTLQELIAPAQIHFYDKTWALLGTKMQLSREIADKTGIPQDIFTKPGYYKHWSVAQKMSWAANRRTKRIEDRAYSLLGLFSIHLPLLYGEGDKAFQRLQLEILQKFSDESIFAWQSPSETPDQPRLCLARSPDYFLCCRNMQPTMNRQSRNFGSAYVQARFKDPPRPTSWGIKIQADAFRLNPRWQPLIIAGRRHQFLFAVPLVCVWERGIRALPCTIVLVQDGPAPFSYRRLNCMHDEWKECYEYLARSYEISEVLQDARFYLQYDADFDY